MVIMVSDFQVNDIIKCIDSTDTESYDGKLNTGTYYVVNRVFKGQVWGLFHSLSVTQLGKARSTGIYQAKRFIKVSPTNLEEMANIMKLNIDSNQKHKLLVQHLIEELNN